MTMITKAVKYCLMMMKTMSSLMEVSEQHCEAEVGEEHLHLHEH